MKAKVFFLFSALILVTAEAYYSESHLSLNFNQRNSNRKLESMLKINTCIAICPHAVAKFKFA